MDGSTYLNLCTHKAKCSSQNIIYQPQKTLKKWPYLCSIQLNEIDADIELVIWVDFPKAMELWDMINSQGNKPYAVKTMFGWVVQ